MRDFDFWLVNNRELRQKPISNSFEKNNEKHTRKKE